MGDGFSCSGNLLQVLMSFPSLTNFLKVCTTSVCFHLGWRGHLKADMSLVLERRRKLTVRVESVDTAALPKFDA